MNQLLVIVALITLVSCNGSQKTEQNPTETTKKLFYMVSPNLNKGPDFPVNMAANSPGDFFNLVKATDNKAFLLVTFTLGGEKGYFLTTAIAYTKDGDGMKGWNIVSNRNGKGEIERKFFSKANGVTADMVLNGALYLVATEIPLEATNESIQNKNLDGLLKPSFDYLHSLL